MSPSTVAVIKVLYRFEHDHHIFTSDDLDGLLVANEDAATVYRQLVPSIKKILKIKTGREFNVETAISLDDLLAHVAEEHSTVEQEIREDSFVLSDKEFCLVPA